MAAKTPTDTIKLTQVREQFSAIVNQVYRKERRILVEKSGIPVAGIVSPEDLDRLSRLDQERAERQALLDEFRSRFSDVDQEELDREAIKAVAEIRAEARTKRIA